MFIALLIFIIKEKKFIFKIEKEKIKFTMEMKYLLINANLCYL